MRTNGIRVLIACEESQTICKAFRERGFEAYSCDILPPSGGHPEWHIQGDVTEVLRTGGWFWHLVIAHPPCTYLAVSGACWMYNKDGSVNQERLKNQNEALDFVRMFMNADVKHIAIENPISVISTKIRKPDQIVHPYHFGDKASKSTCLWLKNLPKLEHTNVVDKGEWFEWIDGKTGKKKRQPMWFYQALLKARTPEERRTLRSKTFQGIANAVADQWGDYILGIYGNHNKGLSVVEMKLLNLI